MTPILQMRELRLDRFSDLLRNCREDILDPSLLHFESQTLLAERKEPHFT